MGKTSRIVILGARGTGKTSILERSIFANLSIDKPYVPTIEDTYVALIETERGTKEKIRFYDTAGLDARNRSLPSHYHSIADGYILVFSVTNALSLQLLADIKKDIDRHRDKKDVPIIVLGNKTDLSHEQVVEWSSAVHWTNAEKLRLWEVNIVNRQSLLEPLMTLASRINPQPSKSSFSQLTIGRKSKE